MLIDSFGVNYKHIDNWLGQKEGFKRNCLTKPCFWLDSDTLLWPQDQRVSRDSALSRRRRSPPYEAVSWNGSSGFVSHQPVWLVTDWRCQHSDQQLEFCWVPSSWDQMPWSPPETSESAQEELGKPSWYIKAHKEQIISYADPVGSKCKFSVQLRRVPEPVECHEWTVHSHERMMVPQWDHVHLPDSTGHTDDVPVMLNINLIGWLFIHILWADYSWVFIDNFF